MNTTFKLRYAIGLLAVITGAIATFDYSILPIIRYLGIYISILVIAMILILDVYSVVDDSPTLEKIEDES